MGKRAGVGAKCTILTRYIIPKQAVPNGNKQHRSKIVLVNEFTNEQGKKCYRFKFDGDDFDDNDEMMHANRRWIHVEEEGATENFFPEDAVPLGPQPDGKWIEPKVKWAKSVAKSLMYRDIKRGNIPLQLDENTMTFEDVYLMHPEYADWDPQKMKGRLKRMQAACQENVNRAQDDQEAFELYRDNHPIAIHNRHGHIQWQGSESQRLLKIDMADNLHVDMKKEDLWGSRPEYYECFPLKVFRDRIYQELRTGKYIHTLKTRSKPKG